jgi:hypothetical protein
MAKQAYLVRREADGTMRTVQALSVRGAMTAFAAEYAPEAGEEFRVKLRGTTGWTWYRITPSGGLREFDGGNR